VRRFSKQKNSSPGKTPLFETGPYLKLNLI